MSIYLYSINEVREVTQSWIDDYNHHRPHDALGDISPILYKQRNLKCLPADAHAKEMIEHEQLNHYSTIEQTIIHLT